MKIRLNESEMFGSVNLFHNEYGDVYVNDDYPGVFAFCPTDDDGKNDDCIYYFSLTYSRVAPMGWNYGREYVEDYIGVSNSWTMDPADSEETEFHDEEYEKYLLDRLQKCIKVKV